MRLNAALLWGIACVTLLPEVSWAKEEMVDDGKLALTIPLGWKAVPKLQAGAKAGFQSVDGHTQVYVIPFAGGGNSSNFDLVRNYIDVYKQNFALIQEGDYKSGKVGDIEAAFQVLDLAILQGDNQVKYRFFLMVFPMGPDAYLIQSSTPLPVHDYRKKEILEIMRSVKVLKSPFD